jgi:hypothetical protein
MIELTPDIGDRQSFCITGWGAAALAAIESAIEAGRLPELLHYQIYEEEDKPVAGCSYYFSLSEKGEGLKQARRWLDGEIVRGQYIIKPMSE